MGRYSYLLAWSRSYPFNQVSGSVDLNFERNDFQLEIPGVYTVVLGYIGNYCRRVGSLITTSCRTRIGIIEKIYAQKHLRGYPLTHEYSVGVVRGQG